MPHQVLKASVKGSTGDLAKITAKLLTVQTGTPGQKINILSISAGEVTIPASNGDPAQEYGVVSMILSPDDPTTTSNVITALTDFSLGGTRKVQHVDVYPLVHVELANVPGSLGAAADAIGDLNIMSVISMGNVAETAHVALAFNTGDETTAADRLTAAGIVVHPPEPD